MLHELGCGLRVSLAKHYLGAADLCVESLRHKSQDGFAVGYMYVPGPMIAHTDTSR
jgi:hypothetical protein